MLLKALSFTIKLIFNYEMSTNQSLFYIISDNKKLLQKGGLKQFFNLES
jgi:hypothetical protein